MLRALTPWRPFRELDLFRHDVDTLFERFFGDGERWPRFEWGGEPYPRLETHVEGNTFVVRADLPGIDPTEVELTVEGKYLTLKGKRKATEERKDEKYYHREVRYGAFVRTVTLPGEVKAEEVKASYHNGVLEVRVPVPAELTAKKVPIEAKGAEPKTLAA